MSELNPELLAKKFHETYERLAPSFGYGVQPWESLPESKRQLLITICKQTIIYMAAQDPPIMDMIFMESGVSIFDGHPFVTIHTGKEKGQLTPAETREHAKHLMACADAAETDALLFRAFKEKDNLDMAQILLSILREERGKGWPERKDPPKDIVK